jgi:hypothetical protein
MRENDDLSLFHFRNKTPGDLLPPPMIERADRINDIPLYTTDKRVARERLEKIVREKQLESVGILPPQAIRTASQTPLDKHLAISLLISKP